MNLPLAGRITSNVLIVASLGVFGGSVFAGGHVEESQDSVHVKPYMSTNRTSGLERASRSDAKWITTTTTSSTTSTVARSLRTVRPAMATSARSVGAQGDAKAFIYNKESGNNPAARNSAGCRGLGQACPGSKLPCSDTDYACQDAWFTGYAISRYGSFENARAFWISKAHPCPKNPSDWCGGWW